MKREFLEKLGLGKAAIDAVMTEHSKSIEEYRNRAVGMEEELNALRETLFGVTAERDALSDLLAKQTEEAEAFRRRVILSAVTEARPSSDMAKQELCRRLDEEAQKGEDLKEALGRIRETDPDAFRKSEAVLPFFSVVHHANEETFPSLSTAMKRR